MKFYIDDNEIKTVNNNVTIEGSLGLISRTASFSYLYDEESDFAKYKARVGSKVAIKDDNDKGIFKGTIHKISYDTDGKAINVFAKDMLSILSNTKIKGRFKGDTGVIISQTIAGFEITAEISIPSLLSKLPKLPKLPKIPANKESNIVSFGGLSIYDVIWTAVSKILGSNFKIYLDGEGKIKILTPFTGDSKGDFIIGANIISSSFSSESDGNFSTIKAIGNNDVVSGSVIRIIEPNNGMFGYFVVQKDTHTYDLKHIMELEVKERSFIQ